MSIRDSKVLPVSAFTKFVVLYGDLRWRMTRLQGYPSKIILLSKTRVTDNGVIERQLNKPTIQWALTSEPWNKITDIPTTAGCGGSAARPLSFGQSALVGCRIQKSQIKSRTSTSGGSRWIEGVILKVFLPSNCSFLCILVGF